MTRESIVFSLALAVIAALGALCLWTPFGVDQAIFVYGGRTVLEGEVLYRDFWDIKPPGIFLFYALGGWLVGLTEPRIHAFELFWQCLLAILLYRTARLQTPHRLAALVAPIAGVGTYYAVAGSQHLTQVEVLLGLPLTASLYSALRIARRPTSARDAIILGVAVGVIGALKPLYLVLPVSFGLLAAARATRSRRRQLRRSLPSQLTRLCLGVGIVWVPLLAYFALMGSLSEMLWTTFGYPSEALRQIPPAALQRLWSSTLWLLGAFLPWAPLLVLGLWSLATTRRSTPNLGVLLYLALGAVLIGVQKISWWEYHFVLLFPPLGLLAAIGMDQVSRARTWRYRRRWIGPVTASILLLLPALSLAQQARSRLIGLRQAAALRSDAPLPIRLDRQLRALWNKTRFLRDEGSSSPGTVYAFGDFRVVHLSGRRQAIAVHGHAWHHLPDRLWRKLPTELMAAEPEYIYIGGYYRSLLRQRSPELWRFIETHYRLRGISRNARWYERR